MNDPDFLSPELNDRKESLVREDEEFFFQNNKRNLNLSNDKHSLINAS